MSSDASFLGYEIPDPGFQHPLQTASKNKHTSPRSYMVQLSLWLLNGSKLPETTRHLPFATHPSPATYCLRRHYFRFQR